MGKGWVDGRETLLHELMGKGQGGMSPERQIKPSIVLNLGSPQSVKTCKTHGWHKTKKKKQNSQAIVKQKPNSITRYMKQRKNLAGFYTEEIKPWNWLKPQWLQRWEAQM